MAEKYVSVVRDVVEKVNKFMDNPKGLGKIMAAWKSLFPNTHPNRCRRIYISGVRVVSLWHRSNYNKRIDWHMRNSRSLVVIHAPEADLFTLHKLEGVTPTTFVVWYRYAPKICLVYGYPFYKSFGEAFKDLKWPPKNYIDSRG